MAAPVTIIEALNAPRLFGSLPEFRALATWRPWLVFLRAVYGLTMAPEDLAIFQRFTGRAIPRPGGYSEAVVITGRQAGKSQIGSAVVAFESAVAKGQPGTWALVIAQDQRSSLRTLLRQARAPFQAVPSLAREVVNETADTMELRNGVTVAAYPCRPAAVRGLRARVVVCDELAFYVSTEGRPTDREMLRAVRPCLATTGGKLLVLSSPYAQAGALWELWKAHYGREDSPVLVWQASAPDMNPTLPADYLERMAQDDPEANRSEVLGEFRAGVRSLFDAEALDTVVVSGRRELPAVSNLTYRAFVDPSGGRADAFTLAIAHRSEPSVVVDVLRGWRPPFNPSGVVKEAAELLRAYGCAEVTGDRYAGEWPRESFRSHGISYCVAERDKSELYLALQSPVNSAEVELPDLPELLRELRALERRRGSSGRDRVDHPRGGHDDRANAVAGVVSLLTQGRAAPLVAPVGVGGPGRFQMEGPAPTPSALGAEREPWSATDDQAEFGWPRRGPFG